MAENADAAIDRPTPAPAYAGGGGGGGYTKKTPWYQRFPTERGVPDRSDGYQKATKVNICITTTRLTVTRTLLKNALSEAATLSCIANDYG